MCVCTCVCVCAYVRAWGEREVSSKVLHKDIRYVHGMYEVMYTMCKGRNTGLRIAYSGTSV